MRDEYNIVQSAARESVIRLPVLFEVVATGPQAAGARTFAAGHSYEDVAETIARSGQANAFTLVFVRDLT